MKNLRLTTLLIALLGTFFLTACSDDDKDDGNGVKPAAASITFDGKGYFVKSGLIVDEGLTSANFEPPSTHYSISTYVIDGKFSLFHDSLAISKNTTFAVFLALNSPDTLAFQSGTFNYIDYDSVTTKSIKDKYYFSEGGVIIDKGGIVDEDGEFNDNSPFYSIVGGSAIVSGTSVSDYTITYNLKLEGGKTLTGTYSGPFIHIKYN